jgi:hypothetical protein
MLCIISCVCLLFTLVYTNLALKGMLAVAVVVVGEGM